MDFLEYAILISLYVWSIFLLINIGGFYLCKKVYFDKFLNRKIFNAHTSSKQHRFEFINGIHSTFIFMLTGFFVFFLYKNDLTVIQNEFNKWGILYSLLSFFLLHTWHDTYFYWTHRAMHEWKFLKKHHLAHHHSKIPTPLAAASFSKVEAIIQGGFYVSAVLFIPAHYSMYLFFYFFITYIAAIGHVEFEFWPNSLYRFPYGSTFNSLTHHNLHHYYGRGNFGLYYRFWDEFCGTIIDSTYEKFYKVQEQYSLSKGEVNTYLRPHPNDILGLIYEEEGLNNNIMIEIGELENRSSTFVPTAKVFKIPHSYCDEKSAITFFQNDPSLFINEKITDYNQVFIIENVLSASELLEKIDTIFSKYFYSRSWIYPYAYINKDRRNSKSIHFNHQLFTVLKVSNNKNIISYKDVLDSGHSMFTRLKYKAFVYTHGIFLKYPFKLICYFNFKYIKRTGTITDLGNIDILTDKSIFITSPVTDQRPFSITSFRNKDKTIISLKILKKNSKLGSSHIQQLIQDFQSTF